MPKQIHITESQVHKLFEAYSEGFDLKKLDELGYRESLEYCIDMLGEPIGAGTSRVVFMLNDDMVLKLAHSDVYDLSVLESGIYQNRREVDFFNLVCSAGKGKEKMVPRVYAHSDSYSWIVSEHVLPCTYEDFEKIFGIPFIDEWTQSTVRVPSFSSKNGGDTKVGYDKYFNGEKKPYEDYTGINISDILMAIATFAEGKTPYGVRYSELLQIKNFIEKNEWFYNLYELETKYNLCDVVQMDNLGIVNRDGETEIVILDAGMNDETYFKFYKK